MKDKLFGVLQRIGRSFMLPIAILPVAGLLLGVGSSLTNQTAIETYRLGAVLGEGTVLHGLLQIMSRAGSVIFDNLPILFAIGVAIGMARAEKEVAALSAAIAFFVMNASIEAALQVSGQILPDGSVAPDVLEGTIAGICGIQTLQTGVFGGILVGLGVAALHNRFYRIVLPNALSFFGGSRFVPVISALTYVAVGIVLYFVWPTAQRGIAALGSLVTGSGYLGTLIFGIVKRALIPFGLHHVFYLPFWQTAVGGTMLVDGQLIQGGQNIFFAQLASPNVAHFSADATRYFSGEFLFMIFGLPGAALAMYRQAKPAHRKAAGGLLFSAALTSMVTGITEPIEFSFLFVAPALFAVQVILAGSAYMVAHMLGVAVGLTFSGGLLDLFLFGILQGNEKTSWLRLVPAGIIYFFLYYFIFTFLIRKFNLKTPGREEDGAQTQLYTRADVEAKKAGQTGGAGSGRIRQIVRGLGGTENVADVDCCATRLRLTVKNGALVDKELLRQTGASGVLQRGEAVQIIYGPGVTVIKSELEEYMKEGEPDAAFEPAPPDVGKREACLEAAVPGKEESPRLSGGDAGFSGAKERILCSPVSGRLQPIEKTPDSAFAEKMMGDGFMVYPSSGVVRAPEDGEVAFLFPTKHAIGMKTVDGLEYLIHVGIDTVRLNGQGFRTFVKDGQPVKKGDKLMEFDISYIRAHAPSDACVVVWTNLPEGWSVEADKEKDIKAADPAACLRRT